MKAESLSTSIKRTVQAQQASGETRPAQTASSAPVADTWEDYIFNEKDLNYYWKDFTNKLPQEEAANAGRMKNMHPKLLKDQSTFEVVVDNEMVQKNMQRLAPQIENYLQGQLHNRKIKMTVRVSEAGETVRAYSQPEKFKIMSEKNPSLLKLQKEFGLELS